MTNRIIKYAMYSISIYSNKICNGKSNPYKSMLQKTNTNLIDQSNKYKHFKIYV